MWKIWRTVRLYWACRRRWHKNHLKDSGFVDKIFEQSSLLSPTVWINWRLRRSKLYLTDVFRGLLLSEFYFLTWIGQKSRVAVQYARTVSNFWTVCLSPLQRSTTLKSFWPFSRTAENLFWPCSYILSSLGDGFFFFFQVWW